VIAIVCFLVFARHLDDSKLWWWRPKSYWIKRGEKLVGRQRTLVAEVGYMGKTLTQRHQTHL
jgi:hypothetical protein